MTEQAKPCLPGCHPKIFGCLDYAERQHAPACYAPKASEAPERCPECKHRPHGTVCFNGESDGDCGCAYNKAALTPELMTTLGAALAKACPAPAPVSNKGAEVDFAWVQTWAEKWSEWPDGTKITDSFRTVARAYLALRAEVETFRKDAQYWKNRFEDLEGDCAELAAAREEIASKDREVDRLDLRWQEVNDQLAAAREEIARFSHHLREQMEATKAQFSRADRADAWAEQLEDVIVEADRIISTDDYPVSLANIATAIIATRQKEESNG